MSGIHRIYFTEETLDKIDKGLAEAMRLSAELREKLSEISTEGLFLGRVAAVEDEGKAEM